MSPQVRIEIVDALRGDDIDKPFRRPHPGRGGHGSRSQERDGNEGAPGGHRAAHAARAAGAVALTDQPDVWTP